jgi:hypothetical protein
LHLEKRARATVSLTCLAGSILRFFLRKIVVADLNTGVRLDLYQNNSLSCFFSKEKAFFYSPLRKRGAVKS